jgi:hypothetical protein
VARCCPRCSSPLLQARGAPAPPQAAQRRRRAAATHVAQLGVLGGLHLDEGRVGELGQPAGARARALAAGHAAAQRRLLPPPVTRHPGRRARRPHLRAISVLPQPVGPTMRMFLGTTSSAMALSSVFRRQRLRSATATALLAAS